MEHSSIDKAITELTKTSSKQAKEKDFNGAIDTFDRVLRLYSQSELFYGRAYVKAIPYFQKAGRYSELNQYCSKKLLPQVNSDVERIFSTKAKSIQDWFVTGVEINIYDKLRLSAKREKISSDEEYYQKAIDRLNIDYDELKRCLKQIN